MEHTSIEPEKHEYALQISSGYGSKNWHYAEVVATSMKKIIYLSLMLISAGTLFASCLTTSRMGGKYISVSIVFEEWHFQYDINGNNTGLIDSISVQLSGKNKIGEAVEVETSLFVGTALYDTDLFRMLSKLDNGGQLKNGNTGSGKLRLDVDPRANNLFIEQIGDMATEKMDFLVPENVVEVFKR